MARRRREKNHFRGITKRISTANMPAAGGFFLMFREILYKKTRSWVHFWCIFCIKHPPKSSNFPACGGPISIPTTISPFSSVSADFEVKIFSAFGRKKERNKGGFVAKGGGFVAWDVTDIYQGTTFASFYQGTTEHVTRWDPNP